MKYLIFIGASLFIVPSVCFLTSFSSRWRGIFLAILIFSPALGDMANIFFVSMEWYRGPDRGFELNLTDLIAWGILLTLLLQYSKRVRWIPYNSLWMFFFLLSALLSAVGAPNQLLCAFTLFKLIKSYLIYWCVYNCVRLGEMDRYVFYGLLSIGLFVTLIVLRQKYMQGIYRVPGPFDHSNSLPPFLNQIIPLLLIWSLCDKSLKIWHSLLGILCSLGMVFAVVATFSRAGTALTGLILFSVMIYANFRAGSRRSYITSVFVFLALLGGGWKASDSFLNRIESAPESSEHARDEFNYAAELMLEDHPIGIGVNNFSYALTVNPRYHEHIQVMADEDAAGVCHHIFWLTAAEMGYPGLIVFCLIIVRFMLRAGWYSLRRNSFESHVLFGVFLGYGALHSSGLLEWAFRITPVFYMFIIISSLGMAYAEMLQKSVSHKAAV